MSELFPQKMNKQGIIGKMRNLLLGRKSKGKNKKMITVTARAGSRRNKRHRKSTRRRRHRKY
jgi:hypothetical protein